MTGSHTRGALVLGALLFAGLTVVGLLASDAAYGIKALERTVTVKGLSERDVPANVAVWPMSFQVAQNDLARLFESVQSKNQAIVAYLHAQGISRSDITIVPPSVVDHYAQSYAGRQQIEFRYTATSTVSVYSRRVAEVRRAMAGVIELGKQGIAFSAGHYQDRTRFVFSGLNRLKPQMIEEATRNARVVAEKFAKDSDSVLGKIRSARQGQFTIRARDATTPHIKRIRVVSTIEYYLSD